MYGLPIDTTLRCRDCGADVIAPLAFMGSSKLGYRENVILCRVCIDKRIALVTKK